MLDLPNRVREDALEAMRLLEGTGATLLAAVRECVRRHPTTAGETVRQTCEAAKYWKIRPAKGRKAAEVLVFKTTE